ncbi:MAG: GyrI-like domain-containing protein [Maricaulaceae bacterium]
MTLTPELKDAAGFDAVGVRQWHDMATAAETVPKQWTGFGPLMPVPGAVDGAIYGITADMNAQTGQFEYMIAVRVDTTDAAPSDLARISVPGGRYAVFPMVGWMMNIGGLWEAIFRDWLPGSGHEPAAPPYFEHYAPGCDLETGEGAAVWLPVRG